MIYDQFRQIMLHTPGVTMVGPPEAPCVGVETEAQAANMRRMVNCPVIVTGPILVTPTKHAGVVKYEEIRDTTKTETS